MSIWKSEINSGRDTIVAKAGGTVNIYGDGASAAIAEGHMARCGHIRVPAVLYDKVLNHVSAELARTASLIGNPARLLAAQYITSVPERQWDDEACAEFGGTAELRAVRAGTLPTSAYKKIVGLRKGEEAIQNYIRCVTGAYYPELFR